MILKAWNMEVTFSEEREREREGLRKSKLESHQLQDFGVKTYIELFHFLSVFIPRAVLTCLGSPEVVIGNHKRELE